MTIDLVSRWKVLPPRTRVSLVLGLAAAAGLLLAVVAPFRSRGLSPHQEGETWDQRDAAAYLLAKDAVKSYRGSPAEGGQVYCDVTWKGKAAAVAIGRKRTRTDADEYAGDSPRVYAWGRLVFEVTDGDPGCLEPIRLALR